MDKTCKDCIHHDVCKRIDYELDYHDKSTKEAEEDLPIKCDSFNDKLTIVKDNHFCSKGERKDGK